MKPSDTLIIFVKQPRIGTVKTRLSPVLGHGGACRLYRTLLRRAIRSLSRSPHWRTVIAITPDDSQYSEWDFKSVDRINQGPGNLGTRMTRALTFANGNPILLIGSDIPGVTPSIVRNTFRLLRRTDVVLGPSFDGGYWCLGVRKPLPRLRGIRWSTSKTLADTVVCLKGKKISYATPLKDIDTIDDLRQNKT